MARNRGVILEDNRVILPTLARYADILTMDPPAAGHPLHANNGHGLVSTFHLAFFADASELSNKLLRAGYPSVQYLGVPPKQDREGDWKIGHDTDKHVVLVSPVYPNQVLTIRGLHDVERLLRRGLWSRRVVRSVSLEAVCRFGRPTVGDPSVGGHQS